jgi:Flp pilus assembly pilin Flp
LFIDVQFQEHPLHLPFSQVACSFREFLEREDGPTAVEYAVMLALIIVVWISHKLWLKDTIPNMDGINPKERRTATRNPGVTIEPVRLRIDEYEIVAIVQDISVEGIGILTRQPLEPGTWLVLEPAEPNRGLLPELRAEVRHTTKLDKVYLIGCRFARFLTTEDVMTLGWAFQDSWTIIDLNRGWRKRQFIRGKSNSPLCQRICWRIAGCCIGRNKPESVTGQIGCF